MINSLHLSLIVILIERVRSQEPTSTPEPDVYVIYNVEREAWFLAFVWILISIDLLCFFLIGFLVSEIIQEIRKNKQAKRELKSLQCVQPDTTPKASPVTEDYFKDEPTRENPSMEIGKEEKTEEKKVEQEVEKKEEKKVELTKKHSVEEWTPAPDDFKIGETEMGPITISTNTVAASDIFVVHKPEPTVPIQQVQFSDAILVYPIGTDVDIWEPTKSVKDGTSSRGGTSIMTASIRQLQKKY